MRAASGTGLVHDIDRHKELLLVRDPTAAYFRQQNDR